MPTVVLSIERREANRRAERFLLERAGYLVLSADTLERAAELLQHHSVDLVLVSDDLATDDQLICARVRGLAPSARIILQRASFDKETAPPDADLVLPKTVNPREKLNAISHLLMPRAA